MQYYKLKNGELIKTDLLDYSNWKFENQSLLFKEYTRTYNHSSYTIQTSFIGAIQDNDEVKPYMLSYFGELCNSNINSTMVLYQPFIEIFRFSTEKEMNAKRKELISNINAIRYR